MLAGSSGAAVKLVQPLNIFLSSPFDLKSADLLNELDVSAFKLGSGELTNFELINYIQKSDKPLILSTGMATLEEIKERPSTTD